MKTELHTILGATGVIGTDLAQALSGYTTRIRVVSRKPKAVNPSDEVLAADLLDAAAVDRAVAGSAVVYLTAGLDYNAKLWKAQWPVLMGNVIAACTRHGAKLLFFDNVYALGLVQGPITESTAPKPCSKKGEVRAQLYHMLQAAQQAGLPVIIARAPDFYGPKADKGFLNAMVLAPMAQGKKPMIMLRDDLPHSYIYTPDAAKGTAILGNTPEAFNQVWNLPTAEPAPTHAQIVHWAAAHKGVAAKHQVLARWMLVSFGWFNKFVGEYVEMLYQNAHPYHFDSSKFNRAFNFVPTPYEKGIAATLNSYQTTAKS